MFKVFNSKNKVAKNLKFDKQGKKLEIWHFEQKISNFLQFL